MNRFVCLCLVLALVCLLCGCSQVSVSEDAAVSLTFVYNDISIFQELTGDEAAQMIDIFQGKTFDPFTMSVPSCGYTKDVSIKIGSQVFAVACDTCNCVMHCPTGRYITVSEEEICYIHTLFEKYGGMFPCV